MAFDSTVGGASANSFVSVADADTYFGERLGSDVWTAASTADRQKALIMSSRYLDKLSYYGERKTDTQNLAFPRKYLPDPDPIGNYWDHLKTAGRGYLDEATIPDRVTYATCELSQKLLASSTLLDDPSLRQFRELQVEGVVRLAINSNSLERVLDRNIRGFLSPLMESGGLGVRLRRG